MPNFPTLIKPPPPSVNKAPIEDSLELTRLSDIEPNLFTNTRPLWHPPGARGIYGGAAIAQCLAAAQKTVPENFTVHSMHCYFVLNGNAEIPVIYHVEAVRDGRSFCTRTVQARQRGQPIFTTTLSFVREGSGGKKTVEHAYPIPEGMMPRESEDYDVDRGPKSPYMSQRIAITNQDSQWPHVKRSRQWLKARGRISDEGGHQAHLSALAYMSDSNFIGTVRRAHGLWFASATIRKNRNSITPELIERAKTMDPDVLNRDYGMDDEAIKQLRSLEITKGGNIISRGRKAEVSMMVSLDHTIYFHAPRSFRADEWIFCENETPWAGDGRGLVFQRMYTRDGQLIATCVQEGLVRLRQDNKL